MMTGGSPREGDGGMKSHFACVPLTTACREGLKAVQQTLADDAKKLNLRPSGLDDINFTLSVFRLSDERRAKHESEEQLVESVNEVLKDFLSKRPRIELTFEGLGSFGSQIFFINVTNHEEVAALRQDMNTVLKQEGLVLADNRFTPHVTLYRKRDNKRGAGYSGGGGVTVSDMVQRQGLPHVEASPVEQIILKRLLGC
ncbi:A-kinase anchor protein 7-like isoform X1 [Eriocheir sinensis]|uniref:A-kinase anchor protein 7-like isoform X1 n=2 Tax=Eriocheir sinensis TaxID=95602 RepID=UPI0021C90079|nr:A-kinase anchor protein 7-like isoform X1 [Eriocheir sinensis]XP_050706865.1 A-kinase anchor protein 7-like isoform X1 [Eriocheir sinensis]